MATLEIPEVLVDSMAHVDGWLGIGAAEMGLALAVRGCGDRTELSIGGFRGLLRAIYLLHGRGLHLGLHLRCGTRHAPAHCRVYAHIRPLG